MNLRLVAQMLNAEYKETLDLVFVYLIILAIHTKAAGQSAWLIQTAH